MNRIRKKFLIVNNIENFCVCCNCDYHSGGCTISKGATRNGETCKCVYKGAWTCRGYDVGCGSHHFNICKANCRSRECCYAGGGDYGGYLSSKKKVCETFKSENVMLNYP